MSSYSCYSPSSSESKQVASLSGFFEDHFRRKSPETSMHSSIGKTLRMRNHGSCGSFPKFNLSLLKGSKRNWDCDRRKAWV